MVYLNRSSKLWRQAKIIFEHHYYHFNLFVFVSTYLTQKPYYYVSEHFYFIFKKFPGTNLLFWECGVKNGFVLTCMFPRNKNMIIRHKKKRKISWKCIHVFITNSTLLSSSPYSSSDDWNSKKVNVMMIERFDSGLSQLFSCLI